MSALSLVFKFALLYKVEHISKRAFGPNEEGTLRILCDVGAFIDRPSNFLTFSGSMHQRESHHRHFVKRRQSGISGGSSASSAMGGGSGGSGQRPHHEESSDDEVVNQINSRRQKVKEISPKMYFPRFTKVGMLNHNLR